MSRQVYRLGVGLALAAGALLLTDWALAPPPGLTAANVRRVQAAMTVQQVERLLGRPAPASRDLQGCPVRGRSLRIARTASAVVR